MKNMMVKIFDARALPRARLQSILSSKPNFDDFWVFKAKWDFACAARGSARAPKFFYHHILHEILHLLDTLDVFIFLKLIVVDVFELYAFSWKKTCFRKFLKFSNFDFFFWKKLNFQKNYQISNSSKNFAFWAMNKPRNLQRDFLTNYTFIKKFWRARTFARGAHQISFRFENSKIIKIWSRRQNILQARAEVRAPKIFTIVYFIKFCISQIPWMYSYLLNWFL